MTTHIFKPKDSAVKSLVELYFVAESARGIEMKTIPNGRVDASIVLEGELEWFYRDRKKFEALLPATFYPLTRTIGKARSLDYIRCIGVKFYPHVLSLSAFKNGKLKEPLAFEEFFKTPLLDKQLVTDLKKENDQDLQTQILDTYFLKQFFLTANSDTWIQEVTHALESGSSANVKIKEIAEDMGMSIKAFERRFRKTIGLTPKSFAVIIQLHQTAKNIQKKAPIVSMVT